MTADQILRTGEARYPVIGAKVVTGGEGSSTGAEISEVLLDTPAEQAYLEEGDVVTQLDGLRVTDGIALIVAIRSHQPGEDVELLLTRGDEELTLGHAGLRGRLVPRVDRLRLVGVLEGVLVDEGVGLVATRWMWCPSSLSSTRHWPRPPILMAFSPCAAPARRPARSRC